MTPISFPLCSVWLTLLTQALLLTVLSASYLGPQQVTTWPITSSCSRETGALLCPPSHTRTHVSRRELAVHIMFLTTLVKLLQSWQSRSSGGLWRGSPHTHNYHDDQSPELVIFLNNSCTDMWHSVYPFYSLKILSLLHQSLFVVLGRFWNNECSWAVFDLTVTQDNRKYIYGRWRIQKVSHRFN